MYSTQRLYLQENLFLTAFQNVKYYIVTFFDILQNGIVAARVVENDPVDREEFLRILFDC